eukprot:s6681_g2.t1
MQVVNLAMHASRRRRFEGFHPARSNACVPNKERSERKVDRRFLKASVSGVMSLWFGCAGDVVMMWIGDSQRLCFGCDVAVIRLCWVCGCDVAVIRLWFGSDLSLKKWIGDFFQAVIRL